MIFTRNSTLDINVGETAGCKVGTGSVYLRGDVETWHTVLPALGSLTRDNVHSFSEIGQSWCHVIGEFAVN